MELQVLANKVIVEEIKTKEQSEENSTDFFKMAQILDNCGLVYAVSEEAKKAGLKKGQKVFFGKHIQKQNINGIDLLVMELSNVNAIQK